MKWVLVTPSIQLCPFYTVLTFPPQHRHRMVVLEPLNKLLQEKWDRLIPRFFFNFACYLVYMLIFTIVAYHQPSLDQARAGWGHPGAHLLEATLE